MARQPQRPPARNQRAAPTRAPARPAPAPARNQRAAPAQQSPQVERRAPPPPTQQQHDQQQSNAGQRALANRPANTQPTVREQAAMPAFLQDRITEDQGKGVSTDQADNLVPMVLVLQPLSPQCLPDKDQYIEHAQAGDLMLKGLEDPIIQGGEGVEFQPCAFYKKIVEWIPRQQGGGFIAQHEFTDDWVERLGLQRTPDPQNPNKVRFMKNGHEFIETRYHAGVIYMRDTGQRIPYVIPFTSTGHTVSRDWMFKMNQAVTASGEKPPTFAKLYTLRTKSKSNNQGTWYVLDISDAGYVQSEEDYEFGRGVWQAFESGALQADVSQMENGSGDEMAGQTENGGDDRM